MGVRKQKPALYGVRNFIKKAYRNKKVVIFCLTLLILAGFFSGYYLGSNKMASKLLTSLNIKEMRQDTEYNFINPLLDCELAKNVGATEYTNLEKKVSGFISEAINSGHVTNISYYYRDLNNGPWVGINEKQEFTPSSLLKVPILIAFLKQAISNPEILKRNILNKKSPELQLSPQYIPAKTLEDDKNYTVEQLLDYMIIFSDNQAKDLLLGNIDQLVINKVYKELSILTPPDTFADDFMTVKEYASLFRVLFNASYLSREMSEKALQVLSQTDFKAGLVQGLPPNIIVAHKFGERQLANGVSQLHDCGIVYFPNHPYLICIMTRGNNYQKLPGIISGISRLTYEEMKEKYQ